jgi:hypothetical protein
MRDITEAHPPARSCAKSPSNRIDRCSLKTHWPRTGGSRERKQEDEPPPARRGQLHLPDYRGVRHRRALMIEVQLRSVEATAAVARSDLSCHLFADLGHWNIEVVLRNEKGPKWNTRNSSN